jgi:hypothetical protein
MNWPLLGSVFPFAAALVITHLFTAYFITQKSAREQAALFAALGKPCLWYLFVFTFTCAAVGSTATFFLFLTRDSADYATIAVLVAWSVSASVCDCALLNSRKHVVLACKGCNVVCAIALFVYTAIEFTLIDFAPLVLVAHIGNAVAVFHVTIVDLICWFDSWTKELAHLERTGPEFSDMDMRL